MLDLGIELLCLGIVCGGVLSGVGIVGVFAYQAWLEWFEDEKYGID